MIAPPRAMTHSVASATLADVLERVLDKGVVIAGDIKIKIADIELLTIQIRLLIASVDKAKEIGLDWWLFNPQFCSKPLAAAAPAPEELAALKARIEKLEAQPAGVPVLTPCTTPQQSAS
jgi:hypothetical protein